MSFQVFSMMNEFSLMGQFLVYAVILVAIAVYIVKHRELTSMIYAIINELKLGKEAVIWYSETLFLNGEAKYERLINDIKTFVQPTPYKINSLILPLVYIDKPEDFQIILNSASALQKSDFYKFTESFFGGSLISVPATVWKLHRRSILPMFNSQNLERYSHNMNKWSRWVVQELRTKANTDEVVNLWDSMTLKTFNLSFETLMGVDPNTLYNVSEKRRYILNSERLTKYISDRMARIWLHPRILFNILQRSRDVSQITSEAMELMSRTISDRRRILTTKMKEGEKNNPEHVLLDTLWNLHPSNKGEEIISESLKREVFFFSQASFDTIALTECNTLLMLAMNLPIQDQIYQEIYQVLHQRNEAELITIDDVENMHLLDRCIKESLRMYPPFSFIARSTSANVELSNGEVAEKGTTILMVPYLLHRRPELYENPLVWNPDNFLPDAVQKRHPYSFIPFSAGPRGCIGVRYAMLSLKLMLATILRKYRFTTDMVMDDLRNDFDIMLRSSNGWKVKVHTRH